jgi:hypothetical protein
VSADALKTSKQALGLVKQLGRGQGHGTISTPEAVALGQRLWWIIKHASGVLDDLKTRFRQEAALIGPGTQRLTGDDGSHCMIHPEAPSLEVNKDLDIPQLKEALQGSFDDFFETVVSYKPRRDFREQIAAAKPEIQSRLLQSVTLHNRQARVVFKD